MNDQDSMQILAQIKRMNEELSSTRQLVSSALDLQSKMLSCESSVNSPQINADFVVGNISDSQEQVLMLDLELGRMCFDVGATNAGMSYFHSAAERVNLSRSKNGFMAKAIRTTISQSSASVREESGGLPFLGRKKEGQM